MKWSTLLVTSSIGTRAGSVQLTPSVDVETTMSFEVQPLRKRQSSQPTQTVQFLSRSTEFETGGGMLTGLLHVRPSSVERLTKTVGTTVVVGRSGIDEISQAWCTESYATLGSLTRSYGSTGRRS